MRLIVAPSFKSTLNKLQSNQPQAILLTGKKGVGLLQISKKIASNYLDTVISPSNSRGDMDEAGGSVSVEKIRELYNFTKGKSKSKRVVIIDNADKMSHGAQNAFLKLLEEPPTMVKFILTTHNPQRLLPTISSRLQTYGVPPITMKQSQDILNEYKNIDQTLMKQILFVAHGRPALLRSLATDQSKREHMVTCMSDARTFLSARSRYDKLAIVVKYSTSRTSAQEFLDSCLNLLSYQLAHKPQMSVLVRAEQVETAYTAIEQMANPKLQLARFVIQ